MGLQHWTPPVNTAQFELAQVTLSGEASCFKGVAQNRDDSCRPPCKAACLDAVKHHSEEVKQSTGYTFDSMDAAKAVDACASQCFNECESQLHRRPFQNVQDDTVAHSLSEWQLAHLVSLFLVQARNQAHPLLLSNQ